LGIFDFLRRKDKSSDTEQRSIYGQTIIGNAFGNASGEVVSKEQALRVAAVWSCVRVLSETIASLPISLYERDENNQKKVKSDNPLNALISQQPSPLFNSFMFFERIMVDLSLDGNSYAYIERNNGGFPIGLHPIKCNDVDVFISPKGRGVYYEIKQSDSENIYPKVGRVNGIDMIHIKGLSTNGIQGKSPIQMAAETLGIALALDKHAGAYFKNGSQLGGILKHPGTLKPETAKRLRESWSNNYSGTSNTGKTAILEEGMDFQARTIPNNQAQFIESRQYQISDICRIFRVPNHLVNDLSNATYSNIEAQQIDFVVHTITPWIKRIESELNAKLVPFKKRGSEYFKFNLTAILRGDSKARADYYRTLVNIGVMSPDEVRKLEDLNSVGGASEDYYMQSNMLPINRLGESTSREELNKENIEGDEQEQE
tara:strand:+ start:1472 stop:2758 length:1287 start_codon:yes stop_codon:yes gene_type:complete